MNSFDDYINELFKNYCPDAARFLDSWNPIARQKAEEARFFFTVGMLIRNDFDSDDVIDWDLAVAGVLCPKCPDYSPDETCYEDPAQCEICLKLQDEYLGGLKSESSLYTEKRQTK